MIEKLASVVRVDDLVGAVERWTVLTGTAPTFVDGACWAQFDTPGGRIALASAEEAPHGSGVMVKVRDLAQVRATLAAAGLAVGAVGAGGHEQRFTLLADGVSVTYYAPL